MSLSKELQIGKAGEHLVCCDLIMQGYNAFLADQGLPFDIVVEKNGKMLRIQVRSATKLSNCGKSKNIYRYGLRNAKNSKSRIKKAEVDYFAFVALNIKEIAYLPISKMITKKGMIKTTMDFKTRRVKYIGRVYTNGTVRTPEWGKYFEDFSEFKF